MSRQTSHCGTEPARQQTSGQAGTELARCRKGCRMGSNLSEEELLKRRVRKVRLQLGNAQALGVQENGPRGGEDLQNETQQRSFSASTLAKLPEQS